MGLDSPSTQARKFGACNVKFYGAKGDGVADDTAAFQAAVNAVASVSGRSGAGGGTVYVPFGTYRITSSIILYSGVIIQGVGASYMSACTVKLDALNTCLFKIGNSVRRVTIRDVELFAVTRTGTIGIQGAGEFPNSSFEHSFVNLTFVGFNRCIDVQGDGAGGQWQFDNIKVDHCLFAECDCSIYLNSQNADYWLIDNCKLDATPGNAAIHLNKGGFVTISSCSAGGGGGGFITLSGVYENLLIQNSQAEAVAHFLDVSGTADYSGIITLVSNITDGPVNFRKNCQVLSMGNLYNQDVQCLNPGTDVKITSIMDEFGAGKDFRLIAASYVVQRVTRSGLQEWVSSQGNGGNVTVMDQLIATVAATDVLTLQPNPPGVYLVGVSYVVQNATTNVTVELVYNHPTQGNQIVQLDTGPKTVGLYTMPPVVAAATTASGDIKGVRVRVTAGMANNVRVSGAVRRL